MNDKDRIRDHIKHMKSKDVSPEYILLSADLYNKLGKPHHISGVRAYLDKDLTSGFEVR